MGHVRPLETRPSPHVTVLNLVILGQTVQEYLTEIRRKNLAPYVLPIEVNQGHRNQRSVAD